MADVHRLWDAVCDGRVVPQELVDAMTVPRSSGGPGRRRYGLGVWLDADDDVLVLTGHDAGVSFHSSHDPRRRATSTVVSNTSEGAWPLARLLSGRPA